MAARHFAYPLASAFLLFLLFSLQFASASELVFYDNFNRDVFTPWTNWGNSFISAINSYVTFHNCGGMHGEIRRTFGSIVNFNYTFMLKANEFTWSRFEYSFNDTSNKVLKFHQSKGYNQANNMEIYYDGTLYNSTLNNMPTNTWTQVTITRTGDFVEFYISNSTDRLSYVSYNLPTQSPVTETYIYFGGAACWYGYFTNVTFYRISILPTKYFRWTKDNTCESDYAVIGSTMSCFPDSIDIPADCSNVTSFMLAKLFALPKAICSGTDSPVTVKAFNPFNMTIQENTTQNFTSCIDNQGVYKYYYNYSATETATGVAEARVSSSCTCWDTFQAYGRLHVECNRPEKTTMINGQERYCEPSTKWCFDSNTLATLDYECNANYTYCPNGCNSDLLICNPAPVVPPELVIDWTRPEPTVCNATDFKESGIGFLLPFCTPLFWALLILFSVAGFFAYAVTKAGAGGNVGAVVFIVIALALSLLYIYYGIFPLWLGIIVVVAEALILAYLISNILGG